MAKGTSEKSKAVEESLNKGEDLIRDVERNC